MASMQRATPFMVTCLHVPRYMALLPESDHGGALSATFICMLATCNGDCTYAVTIPAACVSSDNVRLGQSASP